MMVCERGREAKEWKGSSDDGRERFAVARALANQVLVQKLLRVVVICL